MSGMLRAFPGSGVCGDFREGWEIVGRFVEYKGVVEKGLQVALPALLSRET